MGQADYTSSELPALTVAGMAATQNNPAGETGIVILPRLVRGEHVYFDDDDIESVKLARLAGLDSSALEMEERKYLHEHSAGWVAEVSISLATNFTSEGIIGLGRFVWLKARAATQRGLVAGEPVDVPIRIELTRTVTTGETTDLRTVRIEGRAADVIETLPAALGTLGLTTAERLEMPPIEKLTAELPTRANDQGTDTSGS